MKWNLEIDHDAKSMDSKLRKNTTEKLPTLGKKVKVVPGRLSLVQRHTIRVLGRGIR